MFKAATDNATFEAVERKNARQKLRRFGVTFLDDALLGISPSDLILLGAPSGIGKTQLCCNIALANMRDGKRVHYIALEAEPYEIERRLKYQIFSKLFYSQPKRPQLAKPISYERWRMGDYMTACAEIEAQSTKVFKNEHKGLFVYYKQSKFGVDTLVQELRKNATESDLFIVDHVHYFDFDEDNENRAIKNIAKTVRELALEQQIPIILVAHLRKRDRYNDELVPGIDEFHGSSDLTKIATKVITLAPGGRSDDGRFETFFRISKNRLNGGVTRFVGRVMFNSRTNSYDPQYRVGRASLTRSDGFEELGHHLYPDWAYPPTSIPPKSALDADRDK